VIDYPVQILKRSATNIRTAATVSCPLSIAAKCPELCEVELVGCKGVSTSVLCTFAARCSALRRVDLTNGSTTAVVDAGVVKLTTGCVELRDVSLANCLALTDASVKSIAAHCPQLNTLSLARCHLITDGALEALAEGCRKLSVLDLSLPSGLPHQNVTDAGVAALALGCPLKVFNIARNIHFSDTGVQTLTALCPELQEIRLDWCVKLTDAALTSIAANCPRLRHLHLCGCAVTEYGLEAVLGSCIGLCTLDIAHCPTVSEAWVRTVGAVHDVEINR
jgi:F-box/leucine-rich repeat protein 2/20